MASPLHDGEFLVGRREPGRDPKAIEEGVDERFGLSPFGVEIAAAGGLCAVPIVEVIVQGRKGVGIGEHTHHPAVVALTTGKFMERGRPHPWKLHLQPRGDAA